MSCTMKLTVVLSILLTCALSAPIKGKGKETREAPSVVATSCESGSLDSVDCDCNGPAPSSLKISCSGRHLLHEGLLACDSIRTDSQSTNCSITGYNVNLTIPLKTIVQNFAKFEYKNGRELELFGEEICNRELAKSRTNRLHYFAECSAVLSQVGITLNVMRQLLFSHQCGCNGTAAAEERSEECVSFSPEDRLEEDARQERACTVASFSQWAAQFGYKINFLLYNAEGSEFLTNDTYCAKPTIQQLATDYLDFNDREDLTSHY